MKEQKRIIGLALLTLVLMSWLSFGLHTDPRFAGSYYGGMLGIAATLLILLAFFYVAVRRIHWVKRIMLRVVSQSTLIRVHVYAGILGSVLGLLHTGHKFESPLGIALTAVMLGVVLSGFVGQYLMIFIGEETREKRISLSILEQRYRACAIALSQHPDQQSVVRSLSEKWFVSWFRGASPEIRLAREAHDISESIADLEYALESHAVIKKTFGYWLKVHIFLSALLLVFLAMHIWSSFFFGVRWLQ